VCDSFVETRQQQHCVVSVNKRAANKKKEKKVVKKHKIATCGIRGAKMRTLRDQSCVVA